LRPSIRKAKKPIDTWGKRSVSVLNLSLYELPMRYIVKETININQLIIYGTIKAMLFNKL